MSLRTTSLKTLTQLDSAGLEEKIAELRRSHYDLRVNHSVGQLERSSRLSQVRREIARALTLQTQMKKANNGSAE